MLGPENQPPTSLLMVNGSSLIVGCQLGLFVPAAVCSPTLGPSEPERNAMNCLGSVCPLEEFFVVLVVPKGRRVGEQTSMVGFYGRKLPGQIVPVTTPSLFRHCGIILSHIDRAFRPLPGGANEKIECTDEKKNERQRLGWADENQGTRAEFR